MFYHKGKGKSKQKGKDKSKDKNASRRGGKGRRRARSPSGKQLLERERHVRRMRRRAVCQQCEKDRGLANANACNVKFMPCEHIVLCQSCAPRARRCIFCHSRIEQRILLKEDGIIPPDPDAALESEDPGPCEDLSDAVSGDGRGRRTAPESEAADGDDVS